MPIGQIPMGNPAMMPPNIHNMGNFFFNFFLYFLILLSIIKITNIILTVYFFDIKGQMIGPNIHVNPNFARLRPHVLPFGNPLMQYPGGPHVNMLPFQGQMDIPQYHPSMNPMAGGGRVGSGGGNNNNSGGVNGNNNFFLISYVCGCA